MKELIKILWWTVLLFGFALACMSLVKHAKGAECPLWHYDVIHTERPNDTLEGVIITVLHPAASYLEVDVLAEVDGGQVHNHQTVKVNIDRAYPGWGTAYMPMTVGDITKFNAKLITVRMGAYTSTQSNPNRSTDFPMEEK